MHYKKILLVAFFLSLFVLQQTQASAKFSTNEKNELQPSIIHANGIPAQLHITVAHLNEFNYPEYGNGIIMKCGPGDPFWSCGEGGSGYPYGNENPVLISMEDYILDVVPREMNVAENTHTLASLQAQAIVARSYADYRLRLYGEMDNSVKFQLFVPNAYELYDPSATELIGNAVSSTSGQYLSSGNEAIDAQFASDSINRTTTCLNEDITECHPYLVEVEDPISEWLLSGSGTTNICDAKNNGNAEVDNPSTPNIDERGKVWGMSQKGAIRWSKGNQCAPKDISTYPWPVTWADYRQILAHYYTGVDILNGSGGKVAPDNRWNLLKYEGILDTLAPGQQITPTKIWLQNTSTQGWTDAKLGYRWTGADGTNTWTSDWVEAVTLSTAAGDDEEMINVVITAPNDGKSYNTLHLDVKVNEHWISEQSPAWPDAQIAVTVNGVATPTPTPSACTTWNLTSDFRIAPNQENPNRDTCGNMTWDFLGSVNLTHAPADNYYPLLNFTPNLADITGLNMWSGYYSDPATGQFPALIFNASETPVYWFPANEIDVHPGPNQLSVIAWHSPINGYISITGKVKDNDPVCGDGIVWYLNKNLIEIASGGINASEQTFAAGYGGTELNAVNVSIGDVIYLVIHPNRTYYCDNTGIDFLINATTPPIINPPTPLNGPTSTAFPLNFTPPPPTATFLPTSTIQPTPEEPCDCTVEFLNLGDIYCYYRYGKASSMLAMPIHALQATQQAVLDIQLFHRVEDEVLNQSTEGQHYIDLYYEHGVEIIESLAADTTLKNEAVATLQLWEPNLQALVDGQGNNTIITSGQVQAIETFLDHLYLVASPELRQTIDSERTSNPLEEVIGSTMNQASVNFIDYQVLPTSTTTPTLTATATMTPTATPTPIMYSLSLQPNIANGKDTFLLSIMNTTSHGSYEVMGVGENNDAVDKYARSLIKFDLSAIPSNAIVTSATLSLWTAQDLATNNSEVNVYRLKIPFSEPSATWMSPVTGQNWQIAGASGANDRESTAIGTLLIPASMAVNTEQQILLNPAKVQEWISNTFTNNGVILVASSELNDRFNYKTSDSTTTTQRPKLVIEYYIPVP